MDTKNKEQRLIRRYKNIDILKIICSFLVICIHSPVRGSLYYYTEPIYRVAVPCFFMISGFFINESKIDKQIKKLIFIIIQAISVYLLYHFVICLIAHKSYLGYILSICKVSDWIKLFLVNKVSYDFAGHLWYLFAFLYVLALFSFFKGRYKGKAIISIILIIISYFLGKYSFVLNIKGAQEIWTRNFIFTGIPYFVIGMLIKRNEEILVNKWKQRSVIVFVMIVFVVLCNEVEKIILDRLVDNSVAVADLYLCTPILAISIFVYFLITENTGKEFKRLAGLVKYSTLVYLYHPIVLKIFDLLVQCIRKEYREVLLLFKPVIICFACYLFFGVAGYFCRKKHN